MNGASHAAQGLIVGCGDHTADHRVNHSGGTDDRTSARLLLRQLMNHRGRLADNDVVVLGQGGRKARYRVGHQVSRVLKPRCQIHLLR